MLDFPSGSDKFWFGMVGPYLDAAKRTTGSFHDLRQTSVIWGCPAYRKTANLWVCGYGMNFWPREPQRTNGFKSGSRWTNYRKGMDATAPGYGIYTVFKFDAIDHQSTRPMISDSTSWELLPGAHKVVPARHRGKLGVLFFDGHVEMRTRSHITLLRDDPTKSY
jgi:prepilin-type processing-associated H-X9-DG protein